MTSSKSISLFQSKSCAFSAEEDEILIELVAENPTLYDLRLESYKDGIIKGNIWKYIGSALNKTSNDCKKRWKYIKDSYNRFKRKKKIGTGNTPAPKTSKWEFYDRLKFLELPSSPVEIISNIPNLLSESQNESSIPNKDTEIEEPINVYDYATIVYESDNEEISSRDVLPNITEKIAPKRKRQIKQDEFLQYMKKRDAQRHKQKVLLQQVREENFGKKIDDDDVHSFGEHIKSVLKKLPPILRVKAKAEIFNTMSKYELLSVEMPSTSQNSTYIPSTIASPTLVQDTKPSTNSTSSC